MKKYVEAKKFNFEDIKGISKRQLLQHYTLYEGYVNKVNEIWSELSKNLDYENPNQTYSQIRSLKLGESFAVNGTKLHEMYFENLGGERNKPYGEILKLIEERYGFYEFFKKRFRDIGLSVRGWVILAIDSIDRNIHIFGSDAHDVGSIWLSYPLLIMDVYEHAYMIDFGVDRRKYIDEFFNNINWKVVNDRLKYYNNLFKDEKYDKPIKPKANPWMKYYTY
ncbi:superoxide dismutase [Alkalithermobacter paradoxus]|uniref:superoxide dismutase n=1 Tax=Alkalithermobacter paradoxus TaxID=29349 RepID=A0A1V4IA05_9FIRM|nr:superoxide dismutase [[Clostridium] thermoalcaliphilum]